MEGSQSQKATPGRQTGRKSMLATPGGSNTWMSSPQSIPPTNTGSLSISMDKDDEIAMTQNNDGGGASHDQSIEGGLEVLSVGQDTEARGASNAPQRAITPAKDRCVPCRNFGYAFCDRGNPCKHCINEKTRRNKKWDCFHDGDAKIAKHLPDIYRVRAPRSTHKVKTEGITQQASVQTTSPNPSTLSSLTKQLYDKMGDELQSCNNMMNRATGGVLQVLKQRRSKLAQKLNHPAFTKHLEQEKQIQADSGFTDDFKAVLLKTNYDELVVSIGGEMDV